MAGGKGGASGGRRSVNVTPPTTSRRTPPTQNYNPSGGGGVGIFGMRPIPSSALGGGRVSEPDDEEEVDPETVAASARGRFGTRPPPVQDDPTVQLSRLPVSFIGESIMDPETVYDHSASAIQWREDTHARFDEMPPAPMPSAHGPSADPHRSSTTLARQLDRARQRLSDIPEVTSSWTIIDPRTAVLAPLLGGAVGGFVFMLILLALYAGSP